MDDQRDKISEPETPSRGKASRIPEEADEIFDLLDEAEAGAEANAEAEAEAAAPVDPLPSVKPAGPEAPDYPEEAVSELRSLREKLDRKDKQIEQVMEAYRSKKAETQKLVKRIEKAERRKFEHSKGDFIARFVEVLDNLDRAINSIENTFDPDAVLQGIMLVRSRLVQLLKEEGLEKIFVRGQLFDPLHSEAAGMEEVEDETQDGTVLRELQPGYMLKGALLRVARVVVGRHGSASSEIPSAIEPEAAVDTSDITLPDGAEIPPDAEGAPPEVEAWQADGSGDDLEFSEDGFDFSSK